MNIDDSNYPFFTAIGDLVRVLNDVSENEIVRPQWQYQVPTFVNRGRATPLNVMSLSNYLLDKDCISFITRYWDNCNSKYALNNNEHRDAILKAVFGSVDEGWKVLKDITDDVYDQV